MTGTVGSKEQSSSKVERSSTKDDQGSTGKSTFTVFLSVIEHCDIEKILSLLNKRSSEHKLGKKYIF